VVLVVILFSALSFEEVIWNVSVVLLQCCLVCWTLSANLEVSSFFVKFSVITRLSSLEGAGIQIFLFIMFYEFRFILPTLF